MLVMDRKAEAIMAERFGKDAVIALATVADGVPHVRKVNAYYQAGAFYIVTDSRSQKMAQIQKNPGWPWRGTGSPATGTPRIWAPLTGRKTGTSQTYCDGHSPLGS